jgi:hypothetical protein
MAVQVNSTGQGVEISWDPMGQGEAEGPKPPEFPDYPVDPGYGVDEGTGPVRPDNTLPGDQPKPSHPIYLPPYIDNSLPGDQPVIDNSLPEIEEIGLSDEQIEKLKLFLEGNLPDTPGPDRPTPVSGKGGKQIAVQVFAQGQEGDWSNTAVQPNDGLALLRFPTGFKGSSYVEVRALDGAVIDSGTIEV